MRNKHTSQMGKSDMNQSNILDMKRRDFVYMLLAASGIVLTDSFNPNELPAHVNAQQSEPNNLYPKLREDIVFKDNKNHYDIYCGDPENPGVKIGTVNESGKQILMALDGGNDLESLSDAVFDAFNCFKDKADAITYLASFCAHLGELGLLSSPFYVNIYREEIIHEIGKD